MEDCQACSKTCKDIEYEREKFMYEHTENYVLHDELDATKHMCTASQESYNSILMELLLLKKQNNLLADLVQSIPCRECLYGEINGVCTKLKNPISNCRNLLVKWSEDKAKKELKYESIEENKRNK